MHQNSKGPKTEPIFDFPLGAGRFPDYLDGVKKYRRPTRILDGHVIGNVKTLLDLVSDGHLIALQINLHDTQTLPTLLEKVRGSTLWAVTFDYTDANLAKLAARYLRGSGVKILIDIDRPKGCDAIEALSKFSSASRLKPNDYNGFICTPWSVEMVRKSLPDASLVVAMAPVMYEAFMDLAPFFANGHQS